MERILKSRDLPLVPNDRTGTAESTIKEADIALALGGTRAMFVCWSAGGSIKALAVCLQLDGNSSRLPLCVAGNAEMSGAARQAVAN